MDVSDVVLFTSVATNDLAQYSTQKQHQNILNIAYSELLNYFSGLTAAVISYSEMFCVGYRSHSSERKDETPHG